MAFSVGIICLYFCPYPLELKWVATDITKYSDIRSSTEIPQNLKAHFPEQLPKNATEIHLMYAPPYLQRGGLLQLWLKLPQNEIAKLQVKHQGTEQKTFLLRGYPAINRYDDSGTSTGEILSADYEIIVLGAESTDRGNHGHTYGIAINDVTSKILYWTEVW